jgi:hypothetical protein
MTRDADFYSRPVEIWALGNKGYGTSSNRQVSAVAFIGDSSDLPDNEVGYLLADKITTDYFEECQEDYEQLHARFGDAPIYGVTNVNLDGPLRRRGIGRELYARTGEAAAGETGAYLVADRCSGGGTTSDALRVWASLARDYAVVGQVAYFPPPNAVRRKPVPQRGKPVLLSDFIKGKKR